MPPPFRPAERTALPVIRLTAGPGNAVPADWLTATVELSISREPHRLEISLPPGPTRLSELLPIFAGLTNVVVNVAERQVMANGQTVSCQKGCAACCRQVVPLAPAEAQRLAKLVAALSESRQAQVRERFAGARQRLAEAGLLAPLQNPGTESGEQLRPLGLNYFRLGIACPFLDGEACSIHPDRPLGCREYLVTSPAEHCSRPTPETVQCVPVPGRVSTAVLEVEKQDSTGGPAWVPLILALEWAEAHPEEAPMRTGPEWVQGVFAMLTGKKPG